MFQHKNEVGPGYWLTSNKAYTDREIKLLDELQKTLVDATKARIGKTLYVRKEDLELKVNNILESHAYVAKWKHGVIEEMVDEIMKQAYEPPKEEVKRTGWCYV